MSLSTEIEAVLMMLTGRVQRFEGDDLVVLEHPEAQAIVTALMEVSKVCVAFEELKARNAVLQWKLDNYRKSRSHPPWSSV